MVLIIVSNIVKQGSVYLNEYSILLEVTYRLYLHLCPAEV